MNKRYSKYNAKRTVVDGITFASAKESRRYSELKLLEKAGMIKDLLLQEPMNFSIDHKLIFTYIVDFHYRDDKGFSRYEDVKGFRTPVYRLKKKLIEAWYGIEIEEV